MSRFSRLLLAAGVAAFTLGPAAARAQDSKNPGLPGPYHFAVTGYGAEPADAVREEFHQTYPLSPDGRVALKNVNGGVHVTVWDRNEVKLDAVKTAKDQETLAATQILVDARADSVEIRTDSREHNRMASVEYTLVVPRRAKLDSFDLVNGALDVDGVQNRVHLRTVNGSITARNLGGDVDLATVNGRVNSEIDRLEPNTRISLKSVNGTVDAALPAGASALVKANTVHGKIDSDFGVPDTSRRVGQRLDATLGSGGSPVDMSTVNGAIRIRKR